MWIENITYISFLTLLNWTNCFKIELILKTTRFIEVAIISAGPVLQQQILNKINCIIKPFYIFCFDIGIQFIYFFNNSMHLEHKKKVNYGHKCAIIFFSISFCITGPALVIASLYFRQLSPRFSHVSDWFRGQNENRVLAFVYNCGKTSSTADSCKVWTKSDSQT